MRLKGRKFWLTEGGQDPINRLTDFGDELTPPIRGDCVHQWPSSQDLDTWADEELVDSGMIVQPIIEGRQFSLGDVTAFHEPPTKARVLDFLTASRSSAT